MDGKLSQNVISLALREHFAVTESNGGSLFADAEVLKATLHYITLDHIARFILRIKL